MDRRDDAFQPALQRHGRRRLRDAVHKAQTRVGIDLADGLVHQILRDVTAGDPQCAVGDGGDVVVHA